jgi:glycine/serine hydroxymethyltransferase
MGVAEMRTIGDWIARVLERPDDDGVARSLAPEVRELATSFPLFSRTPVARAGVRAG